MRHRLLAIFSAASLAACLVISCLWAWNWMHSSYSFLGIGRQYWIIEFEPGPMTIKVIINRYTKPLTKTYPEEPWIRTHGFGWFASDVRQSEFVFNLQSWGFAALYSECDEEFKPVVFLKQWSLELPNWFSVVLTAMTPAVMLIRMRRSRLDGRESHCAVCGYNLRATPDRCPECGHVPAKEPVTVK